VSLVADATITGLKLKGLELTIHYGFCRNYLGQTRRLLNLLTTLFSGSIRIVGFFPGAMTKTASSYMEPIALALVGLAGDGLTSGTDASSSACLIDVHAKVESRLYLRAGGPSGSAASHQCREHRRRLGSCGCSGRYRGRERQENGFPRPPRSDCRDGSATTIFRRLDRRVNSPIPFHSDHVGRRVHHHALRPRWIGRSYCGRPSSNHRARFAAIDLVVGTIVACEDRSMLPIARDWLPGVKQACLR
jgi:hypothetical protein